MKQRNPIGRVYSTSLVCLFSMAVSLLLLSRLLGIFENLLGFNPQLSSQLVSKTPILVWLLSRIQSKTHEENRGYAAEILSILLQDNHVNRLELGKKDGVEVLLKVLSVMSDLLMAMFPFNSRLAIPAKRSCGRGRNRVYGKYFRSPLLCVERASD
jgi:hypothetical protein